MFSWNRLWISHPGRKLLASIRDYQRHQNSTLLSIFLRKWAVLRHRFWSVVTGSEINLTCSIGGGLLIPHPNGIVIHPGAVIGNNCLIFQQVTITGEITLGNHVDIGAGAKLLGPLIIEDHVLIGANAVVTKNIGTKQTVVGVPAKPLPTPTKIMQTMEELEPL